MDQYFAVTFLAVTTAWLHIEMRQKPDVFLTYFYPSICIGVIFSTISAFVCSRFIKSLWRIVVQVFFLPAIIVRPKYPFCNIAVNERRGYN